MIRSDILFLVLLNISLSIFADVPPDKREVIFSTLSESASHLSKNVSEATELVPLTKIYSRNREETKKGGTIKFVNKYFEDLMSYVEKTQELDTTMQSELLIYPYRRFKHKENNGYSISFTHSPSQILREYFNHAPWNVRRSSSLGLNEIITKSDTTLWEAFSKFGNNLKNIQYIRNQYRYELLDIIYDSKSIQDADLPPVNVLNFYDQAKKNLLNLNSILKNLPEVEKKDLGDERLAELKAAEIHNLEEVKNNFNKAMEAYKKFKEILEEKKPEGYASYLSKHDVVLSMLAEVIEMQEVAYHQEIELLEKVVIALRERDNQLKKETNGSDVPLKQFYPEKKEKRTKRI